MVKTMNFYVNGEHIGEMDSPISLNTRQEFLIGAGANERANHEYRFKGKIDEVRIYDRELSADEGINRNGKRKQLLSNHPANLLRLGQNLKESNTIYLINRGETPCPSDLK